MCFISVTEAKDMSGENVQNGLLTILHTPIQKQRHRDGGGQVDAQSSFLDSTFFEIVRTCVRNGTRRGTIQEQFQIYQFFLHLS